MGAAAIPLALTGASIAGSVYSAKKQSSAAKKQQESLEKSQAESRELAERGRLDLLEYYGKAMEAVGELTPQAIEALVNGNSTASQILSEYTSLANGLLGDSAVDYKNTILGTRPEQDMEPEPQPFQIGPDGRLFRPDAPEVEPLSYGLSASERALIDSEQAARDDIIGSSSLATGDLQGAANRGLGSIRESFGDAIGTLSNAERASINDIAQGYTRAGMDIDQANELATQEILKGKGGALSSLRGGFEQGRRDLSSLTNKALFDIRQGEGRSLDALKEGTEESSDLIRQGLSESRGDIQRGYDEAGRGLRGYYDTALDSIDSGAATGRSDLRRALRSAQGIQADTSALDPYSGAGQKAIMRELALSGADGAEAQQKAYDEFIESPAQKFMRERQEQSLLRNAAATGGLQGGNVLTALQEQSQGIAAQDLQREISNLQSISGRGQQAAGMISNLRTGANQARGQLSADIQSRMADLANSTGLSKARLQSTLGDRLASLSTGRGSALAGLSQGAYGNLANLSQGEATWPT
jgi:hypothetical protein